MSNRRVNDLTAHRITTNYLTIDGVNIAVAGTEALVGNQAVTGTITVGEDATGYDVKFYGDTTGKYWMWDESADLMVVTGGSAFTGNTSFGIDDTGVDVVMYGATSGKYCMWDESADKLIIAGDASCSGTFTVTGTIARTSQRYVCSAALDAKVGGTAGWVVAAADNLALVTCPASQTGSKLVIPIRVPLKVGWTITAFSLIGQIESAGNTVTLDADLRKHTAAAGDVADASVGSITQISVTADTAVSTAKTGLAEVVAADETFYLLLTATTGASTDIALQGYTITVTEI